MSLQNFITSLGATHFFTFNNEGTDPSEDLGDSIDPTYILTGTYSFSTNPLCEGVTHCLESTSSTESNVYGAILASRSDINNTNSGTFDGTTSFNYNNHSRTLILWASQPLVQNASCIYEQGANNNNFAFIGGALVTFQAAHGSTSFLIAQAKVLTQENRPYFYAGVWEHSSQNGGSGNRILFYINGVLQNTDSTASTSNFPGHSGNISVANAGEVLRSYSDTVLETQTVEKRSNMLGMFNLIALSESQIREFFERTVLPSVEITADTVANQQIALDALTGNSYSDVNLAIRIVQATDATDYRLIFNNIQFVQNPIIKDIAVQYVGPNTLTIENANGSNVIEVSTPSEIDKDFGTTILTGGGTISIIENVLVVDTAGTITGEYNKLIISTAGTYDLDRTTIPIVENLSLGAVTLNLLNSALIPTTLLETTNSITVNPPTVIFKFTNIPTGTEGRIRQGSETLYYESNITSGEMNYVFLFLDADPITYSFIKPGLIPINETRILTSSNQDIPLEFQPDPSYIT